MRFHLQRKWNVAKCSEVQLGEVWWSVAKCCSVVMFFWFFFIIVYMVVCFVYFFNSASYVFLLLCLCILIDIHALFCTLCFHRANWHSSTTLTEVFPCFFLSCKANAMVYLAKTRHGPHSSKSSELCCSVYCLYVNVYCTTVTEWQPNCS